MQKPSRLTLCFTFGLIVLATLQLRGVARAWQDDATTKEQPKQPESEAGSKPREAPPEPSPEAEDYIRQARDRLTNWQSVKADIVERIDIGGRRFKAEGTYIAGPFPKTRFEYQVQVGDTVGTLLEVCEGPVLHILRTIDKVGSKPPNASDPATTKGDTGSKPVQEAIRRDVQRILRAAPNAKNIALPMHAADLGLGGLAATLASLERTMVFESIKDVDHDGRKFRVVQGRWNPASRSSLLTTLGPSAPQLEGFIPDRVDIWFETETQFPVRILYLQKSSTTSTTYRPVLSLEFHDVEFDVPIPADAFEWHKPAGVEEGDDTENFIQLLRGTPPSPTGQPSPVQ
jgi:hypothetical protein